MQEKVIIPELSPGLLIYATSSSQLSSNKIFSDLVCLVKPVHIRAAPICSPSSLAAKYLGHLSYITAAYYSMGLIRLIKSRSSASRGRVYF